MCSTDNYTNYYNTKKWSQNMIHNRKNNDKKMGPLDIKYSWNIVHVHLVHEIKACMYINALAEIIKIESPIISIPYTYPADEFLNPCRTSGIECNAQGFNYFGHMHARTYKNSLASSYDNFCSNLFRRFRHIYCMLIMYNN